MTSIPCCAHIRPDGNLCAARPLPGRDRCLFHDPEQAEALAQGRSKGGSSPRRRLRRFPRVLDHLHVGELLSELFIESLNHPEAIDTKRLQALTGLARTLLQAVGIPKDQPHVHVDHTEPLPTAESHRGSPPGVGTSCDLRNRAPHPGTARIRSAVRTTLRSTGTPAHPNARTPGHAPRTGR